MFVVGADIGKVQDYTALAVVEKKASKLHLRHTERLALGTPYPNVVTHIATLSRSLPEYQLVVDATDERRLRRAVDRGMNPEDVERRMRSQPSRDEWLSLADLVIPNHGSIADLEATVDPFVQRLL